MTDGFSAAVVAGLESDGFEVEPGREPGVLSVTGRDGNAYRQPVQLVVHESDVSEYCTDMVRNDSYPSSIEEASGLAALHVQEELGVGHRGDRNMVRRLGFRRMGSAVELFVDSERVDVESSQPPRVNTWVTENP